MGLELNTPIQIYRPFWQVHDRQGIINGLYVAVRSSFSQDSVESNLRAIARSLDPDLALADTQVMGNLVMRASSERRFQTLLLSLFAGISMFLAMVGIYGLLAYMVRQRTGEIGLRMALGSTRLSVMQLILRHGFRTVGGGLLLGLAISVGFVRLLRSFLFHVPALDPVTYSIVPILVLAATFAACLIPGLRAAAIDPMEALRHE
jgi:ABC-type antimicrobial peptide transport system permease subunit